MVNTLPQGCSSDSAKNGSASNAKKQQKINECKNIQKKCNIFVNWTKSSKQKESGKVNIKQQQNLRN